MTDRPEPSGIKRLLGQIFPPIESRVMRVAFMACVMFYIIVLVVIPVIMYADPLTGTTRNILNNPSPELGWANGGTILEGTSPWGK